MADSFSRKQARFSTRVSGLLNSHGCLYTSHRPELPAPAISVRVAAPATRCLPPQACALGAPCCRSWPPNITLEGLQLPNKTSPRLCHGPGLLHECQRLIHAQVAHRQNVRADKGTAARNATDAMHKCCSSSFPRLINEAVDTAEMRGNVLFTVAVLEAQRQHLELRGVDRVRCCVHDVRDPEPAVLGRILGRFKASEEEPRDHFLGQGTPPVGLAEDAPLKTAKAWHLALGASINLRFTK
mmetsp:Transcript_113759/g.316769  ORF Transcript_113759/g.316769 Transcript_113759/m.316769 type:complete len:241 (+) Transcript_113759:27-749(+)